MRRARAASVVFVLAVSVASGCDPAYVGSDEGWSIDTGSRLDVPGLDAPGLDVPGLDVPGLDAPALDAPALDVPGLDVPVSDSGADAPVDVGGSDAGDFDGHIVRLANMRMTPVTVELCIYPDGIGSPPTRMMEALGRPAGLARLEVSARHAFTATRATVPVRVVDASTGNCDTPIFETAITSSRTRVVFVLGQLSFTGVDDTLPTPTADDQWRHLFHDGASGVLAMTAADGMPVFRPSFLRTGVSEAGALTYTNFDMVVLIDRPFTPLPGGALTSFSLAPSSTEAYVVLCDDRAPPVAGLTMCGDTVRP